MRNCPEDDLDLIVCRSIVNLSIYPYISVNFFRSFVQFSTVKIVFLKYGENGDVNILFNIKIN